MLFILLICWLPLAVTGKILNIEDFGAVAGSQAASTANTLSINKAFAAAHVGDTILVPSQREYWALGGITASNLSSITLQIDGTLRALPDLKAWPTSPPNSTSCLNFIDFSYLSNFTLTGHGSINGEGKAWWNHVLSGLKPDYSRPHLIVIHSSIGIRVTHIRMINSPSFHLLLDGVAHAEVFNVSVFVDRQVQRALRVQWRENGRAAAAVPMRGNEGKTGERAESLKSEQETSLQSQREDDGERESVQHQGAEKHSEFHLTHTLTSLHQDMSAPIATKQHARVGDFPLQPEDLNTDGIDVSGRDVWVHNCTVLNDDDSIAVKPTDASGPVSSCSENMLFEDLVLTGFGASIGSVPPHDDVNCVRNITFRRIRMPGTGKGIYIKSNPSCEGGNNKSAIIANLTFEDFIIDHPRWWAVWIGPQQQHEPHEALGDKCALTYPINPHCPTQGCVQFNNILLKNILIIQPLLSPGVILGNSSNPMSGLIFDNVTVTHPSSFPFGPTYQCEHVDGCTRNSFPAPACLREC
eukprot:m.13509 g.13509  ORF g.13509 m.13509 type:complete len:525 (-) comp6198_c0_seq1:60-1634(-)